MMNQMDQAQMLHWIDMVSFPVVDMGIYLDTHPCDMEALKYYNHYLELRKTALEAYTEKYGPLTMDLAASDSGWTWGDMPSPWEGGNC